jgi:hypothetical protein
MDRGDLANLTAFVAVADQRSFRPRRRSASRHLRLAICCGLSLFRARRPDSSGDQIVPPQRKRACPGAMMLAPAQREILGGEPAATNNHLKPHSRRALLRH